MASSNMDTESVDSVARTEQSCNPSELAARGQKKGKKDEGRKWQAFEEDKLMDVLKMAIAGGMKSEQGWKANFKTWIKIELDKLLPGTDLQAEPHINSKLKQWGKEYACVSCIKDKSGAGWNATEKRLSCEPEFWNTHAKNWSGMKSKNNWCWPRYDDWEYIFGKDRANGKGSYNIKEAAAKFIPDLINNGKKKLVANDEPDGSAEDYFDVDGGVSGETTSKRAKTLSKAAASSTDDSFVESISRILEKHAVNVKPAAESLTLGERLNGALKDLGLNMSDRLDLGGMMVDNEKWLKWFFSLDNEERLAASMKALNKIGTYQPCYD